MKTMTAIVALGLMLAATSADAAAPNCKNADRGRLHSVRGDHAVQFSIFNASSTPRVINWIDYNGRPKTYAFLQPGQGLDQKSYETHVWEVLDQVGTCKNVYQLGPYNLNIRLSD